jgi:hypothetical protein
MHDDNSDSGGWSVPHPSDLHPPDPSFWQNPLLPQGLGLAGLSAGALLLLAGAFRASRILGVLATPLLGATSFLAAWAAAIHLTGGEKFDDHPWV